MGFYDMCVMVENVKEVIGMARKLGWNGLGLLVPYSSNYMRDIGDLRESVKKIRTELDISFGVEINPNNLKNGSRDSRDIRKIAKAIRKETELVVVRGCNPETDRIALEIPEVDMLTHHEDMRINQVLAKLATKNNVAIGFIFSNILLSYKRTRISLFSDMIKDAKILKKYKAPFVLSSGSLNEWDIRSPSDLMAFGRLLGFQDNQSRKAMSNAIIKENRKRLGKKWVMPGVEIE
jgi:ribonuclease P/MRP protein subunit RPP1